MPTPYGMFVVAESFVCGKTGDPVACEDLIADGPDFVVVCDGATDKSGLLYGGQTGGRVVAELVCSVIAAARSGTSALDLAALVSAAYRDRFAAHLSSSVDRPTGSFCALDKRTGALTRVGDTSWRTADQIHLGAKHIDAVTSGFRAATTRAALLAGTSPRDIAAHDPGRAAILPLLREQARFLNNPHAGEFAFGGVDGQIPEMFVEQWQLLATCEAVVLASDGYPELAMTLADSEASLRLDLAADPLRIGVHAGTKSLAPTARSFDDRAFIRLNRISS